MLHALAALIGIMSAMPQEADFISDKIENKEIIQIGTHQFIQGNFENTPVVFALAGVGKVSAATTAALLIARFNVDEIIFTGVAGGGHATQIGDIVVGSSYLQHDLTLQPLFPPFYVYSLGKQLLHGNSDRVSRMKAAAHRFLQQGISFPDLGITNPQVHEGVIVSGDQFIFSSDHHQEIVNKTKEVLPHGFHAIEMEGAAVAQVCTELDIPFVVIRAISDKANADAPVNFFTFMDQVASHYSYGVLKEYLQDSTLPVQKQDPSQSAH